MTLEQGCPTCEVIWAYYTIDEATCELEEMMQFKYLIFSLDPYIILLAAMDFITNATCLFTTFFSQRSTST